METKELKIVAPKGYEIDKENSTFEKIVFKEIDTKPKSWGEYCKQQAANGETGYYIFDTDCSIDEASWVGCATFNNWRNILPSRKLAESFIAMMQLVSLRQSWVGDWKPDWKDFSDKWCIVNSGGELLVGKYIRIVRVLSFPTEKMVNEFMRCFRDLLEIAKPLI